MKFEEVYRGLNAAQKIAVDQIDGPLLVLAGPGTGKTQLLSARVAHILRSTDTLPQNILCLTFTENGAANMRDRLHQFIGKPAYDVTISTYHAFGSDIIARHREYFVDEELLRPIDTLRKHQIVSSLVDKLAYRDRLKQAQHHLRDLIATISEMKRALLTPDDMRALAAENDSFMHACNTGLVAIFDGISRMPGTYIKAAPYYQKTLQLIKSLIPPEPAYPRLGSLAEAAATALESALADAASSGKSTPMTAWKNAWLARDARGHLVIDARFQNERLASLAHVFESYERALRREGLYDFDDMILKAIHAIESHDDLRLTLQERYQYILLDEYQDTNAAQARLICLLTDNPVHEGRPNIMAVGDDDQAIYAFQGAKYSNMLDFARNYRDTSIINLSKNYRSHHDILQTAQAVATQIDERLTNALPTITKKLSAAPSGPQTVHIERRDFRSAVAENGWIAGRIAELIKQGTSPHMIAVLTPKHRALEPLVAHLAAHNISVHYEKRENILDTPIIRELLALCRLVVAIGRDESIADGLWPEVLSAQCFEIPTHEIWAISWRLADTRTSADGPLHWTRELLSITNPRLRSLAIGLTAIAARAEIESCEQVLDYLIGSQAITTHESDAPEFISPFRSFYLAATPSVMYDALSHLIVLRSTLRERQNNSDHMLTVRDLLELVEAYQAADEMMLNTSPYIDASDSVQLMTVYKAKGLEWQHVFLVSVTNELWGDSGRSKTNALTLPANLAPTRHSGATDDERLRLLYVALTRAKSSLYLTSHTTTYSGSSTTRLKYLDERETNDETLVAHTLPKRWQAVRYDDTDQPTRQLLERHWLDRHAPAGNVALSALLNERITKYQLSPTHLNAFCDLVYGGPMAFYINTILRFPSAPTIDGQYGNAVHETLDWLQKSLCRTAHLPLAAAALEYFEARLRSKHLPLNETERLIDRGRHALTAYLKQRGTMFSPTDTSETSFHREGVFIDTVHMAGKIDRLEIDPQARTITVVDYKTGRPHSTWRMDPKLHKYQQQLYCYKLLVEGSHTYRGYTVTSGRLEFVEPDDDGVCRALTLEFKPDQLKRTRQLLTAMWQHVHALDFPDISAYDRTLGGIKAFEDDLITQV